MSSVFDLSNCAQLEPVRFAVVVAVVDAVLFLVVVVVADCDP